MSIISDDQLEMYRRWGKEPPAHYPHGTDEEIRKNMKKANPTNWRLEGNKLTADTEFGTLVNYIDSSYILKGVDEDGLPVLVKVGDK